MPLLYTLSLLLAPLLLIFVFYRPAPDGRSSGAPPPAASRLPVLGSLGYFSRKWEFWRESRDASPTGNFRFNLAGWQVIGLNGDKGREHFFGSTHYSFSAGYAVLFGLAPDASDVAAAALPEGEAQTASHFQKRIISLMKRERLVTSLNHLMKDTNARLDDLGTEGITNPFDSIYLLVFQLTVRMVGCREIADDPVALAMFLELFEDVERSSTMLTILFPWLPLPAKIRRTVSATKLYIILQKIVKDRQKYGRSEDDALQHLMDEGDSLRQSLEFVIGAIFAGQLNSGINACYILCYLSLSPKWLALARAEITSVAAKYATLPSARLQDQILDIPLEAWENEFPVLDLCLKDTIRLHLQGAALRRNISGKADRIGEEVVPDGTILAYHLGDVHMDPSVYPDPEKWDPSRYLPDRAEDKKVPFGWLGWGVARHPCLGMKFAKLEQNLILAFFLARYDFSLCDAKGAVVDSLPPLNVNAHSAEKPSSPVFLKYSSRA